MNSSIKRFYKFKLETKRSTWLFSAASVFRALAYTGEQRASWWKEQGKRELMQSIGKYEQVNRNHAKNVVVMIGDGMSLGTAVAGRIKTGQDRKGKGEEHMTSLDTMPFTGLAKTYSGALFGSFIEKLLCLFMLSKNENKFLKFCF